MNQESQIFSAQYHLVKGSKLQFSLRGGIKRPPTALESILTLNFLMQYRCSYPVSVLGKSEMETGYFCVFGENTLDY